MAPRSGTPAVAGVKGLCSSFSAHPLDRFPQWMHRRKIAPGWQVTPKS
jgi:hypothetical protein